MVIPSIPPRIKFRPISANFGRNSFSGRYEFCLLIFPFWTWSASFLLDHQKSFSFSHLYLIFTLVAPCLSIISHYLTLSTVTEKLKIKLKSKMKQKKCDLRNKKGEEEDEKRRKYLRRWNDEERVAIMKDVAFEQIVLSLVTWVGWEMGEAEKVVSMKLLESSLVYDYTKCEFFFLY